MTPSAAPDHELLMGKCHFMYFIITTDNIHFFSSFFNLVENRILMYSLKGSYLFTRRNQHIRQEKPDTVEPMEYSKGQKQSPVIYERPWKGWHQVNIVWAVLSTLVNRKHSSKKEVPLFWEMLPTTLKSLTFCVFDTFFSSSAHLWLIRGMTSHFLLSKFYI